VSALLDGSSIELTGHYSVFSFYLKQCITLTGEAVVCETTAFPVRVVQIKRESALDMSSFFKLEIKENVSRVR